MIHFGLLFVKAARSVSRLLFYFCKWTHSCSSITCWKDYLCSISGGLCSSKLQDSTRNHVADLMLGHIPCDSRSSLSLFSPGRSKTMHERMELPETFGKLLQWETGSNKMLTRWGLPRWFSVKKQKQNLPANAEDTGLTPESRRSPGEGNGTHSGILAWEIPLPEGPGGLQSMDWQKSKTQQSD